MIILLYLCILCWTFLEATFWWVAPDISIGIAFIYFPQYWRRFISIGILGSLLGTLTTFFWAKELPTDWLAYVKTMPFHTLHNINFVNKTINDPLTIIIGAWSGIPYKLFVGIGAIGGIALTKFIIVGLLSRFIRFSFVLGVTSVIRYYTKSFSAQYPARMALILMLIWITAIALFDIGINRLL
ncbi:hypothetical protein [Legionella gresilensis]|uniref:hypothetical protein n=1 Tax=Legionella gresilensis TaxID=91823 RepID=UPI0010411556|nr:hypothetical protein [Legionella gresilensis]